MLIKHVEVNLVGLDANDMVQLNCSGLAMTMARWSDPMSARRDQAHSEYGRRGGNTALCEFVKREALRMVTTLPYQDGGFQLPENYSAVPKLERLEDLDFWPE